MSKLFYLSEIIQFAIEKEKESYELYRELSEITDNENAKNLFQSLMREEKQHEDFYTNMLKEVDKVQSVSVVENDEYTHYMQELISASRSTAPLALDQIADVKSAISYAMGREKDSILFYVGLENFVPKYEHDKIEVIIREEAKHLAKLSAFKKQL